MSNLTINGASTLTASQRSWPHASTGIAKLGEITSQWELVSPDLATKYLTQNTKLNRNLNPALVSRYVKDMESADWQTTHQGIAFSLSGDLVDGQHRLQAICDSGISQWLLVTRGLSEKALESLDRGKMRSLAQTLKILGYEIHDNRSVAIARAMLLGTAVDTGHASAISDSTIRRFIDLHHEAVLFAIMLPKRVGSAKLTAVFGRAYYHASSARLQRFVDLMLMDGGAPVALEPGDKCAIILRFFSLSIKSASGSLVRSEIYRKAQNALWHFLQGKDMSKLTAAASDLFPLPKE